MIGDKKIPLIFVIFLLISSFFVGASSVEIQSSSINPCLINKAELPTWYEYNFWKYDMDFVFTAKNQGSVTFSVNAEVDDMYATVIDIVSIGEDVVYVLSIDGEITGDVSLFDAGIEVAEFYGDFGGTASISITTLGIKEFIFEVDGEVHIPIIGWRDMYFEMIMGFDPCFDFFDFPIVEGEEPWDVYIEETTLYAYVDIDIIFGQHEYSGSMAFSDVMSLEGIETINVPAGQYETFLLSGTWGYDSNLWYAPVAGYLAKVDEILNWDDGAIEAEFYLELLDTNYDVGNDPPNPPDKPYGPTQGEVEKDYTFSTQTNDPNGDKVYYWFDWGDETNSGWLGPYNSGQTVTASHRWYKKGAYIVIAKAKDEAGIASEWSEPLSVLIAGDPKVTILMHRIEKKDEIDNWAWPSSQEPEWYYMCHAKSEGTGSPPQTYHNTDDGTYNGEWNSQNNWEPDKEHNFTVDSRNVTIKVKLMDYDSLGEGGADDLADASGCDYPDCDGYSDGTPDKRGAIYHGTYDLVNEELKLFDSDPDENADFVYKDDGYYLTCGDYEPDNSTEYENGLNDPQNDALVYFRLTNDYNQPQALAQIMTSPDQTRPYEKLQFAGIVIEGVPSYSWHWDFGDGATSDKQNPVHTYYDKGMYTVTLTVTDGFDQVSSHSIEIDVKNDDPILTNDGVEWTGGGNLQDTFTFSVRYIDPDLDLPSVAQVVIDGEGKTLNGEGSNAEYSLKLLGSEIGKGDHKYYFYFEDGHGGSAKTPEKTFEVKKGKARFFVLSYLNDLFDQNPILFRLIQSLLTNSIFCNIINIIR